MISCNEIASTITYLKNKFVSCSILSAEDMNLFVDLVQATYNCGDSSLVTELLETKVNRLDNIQIKTSWASYKDEDASTERKRYSPEIDGNVILLSVTFHDFAPLKKDAVPNAVYTLLIDRFRHQERRNNLQIRKAGYKHEDFRGGPNGRINEIVIDNSTMILDFGQEHFFKPYTVYTNPEGFPAPKGISGDRFQNGFARRDLNIYRRGFVDLGFRIRMEITGTDYIYETPHLGFIRMLGVSELVSGNRYITYSNRHY